MSSCTNLACQPKGMIRPTFLSGNAKTGVGIKRIIGIHCGSTIDPMLLIGQSPALNATQFSALMDEVINAGPPILYAAGYTGKLAEVTFGDPQLDEYFNSDCDGKHSEIAGRTLTFKDYSNSNNVCAGGTIVPYQEMDIHQTFNDYGSEYLWAYIDCNNNVYLFYTKSNTTPGAFTPLQANFFSYVQHETKEVGSVKKTTQCIMGKLEFVGEPLGFYNRPLFNLSDCAVGDSALLLK